MADFKSRADRYANTPRRIFDKHVDRMELKRQRDREDHRNDVQAVLQRIRNLETQLTKLEEHVAHHCSQLIDEEGDMHSADDTEEL